MDQALPPLARIKELASEAEPLDPVVVSLIPEKSAPFYKDAPVMVAALLNHLQQAADSSERLLDRTRLELSELREAVNEYAVQSGEGQLFHQNLALCLTQIKERKKTPGRL